MNHILGGGGFGSRLFDEIRVKRGFTYSVHSMFIPEKKSGSFQVVLQSRNSSALEAVELVRREMKRIQESPVSESELQRAKLYMVGSFPLRFDTQSKLARFLSQVEYYGLGLDYPDRYPGIINSITGTQVMQAAHQYLHPDNYLLVIVGDCEER